MWFNYIPLETKQSIIFAGVSLQKFICISIYNVRKVPNRYAVQGIRRGGNDVAHSCFFVRTTEMNHFINFCVAYSRLEVAGETPAMLTVGICAINLLIKRHCLYIPKIQR